MGNLDRQRKRRTMAGKKQNKTKQNKTKQNKTKQNKTNKTKQNKTKQNKAKQNKTKQTNKQTNKKTKTKKKKQRRRWIGKRVLEFKSPEVQREHISLFDRFEPTTGRQAFRQLQFEQTAAVQFRRDVTRGVTASLA